MKVGFTFTGDPPGGPFRALTSVLYEVHDEAGNLIKQGEAGEVALVELTPGKYCINGVRNAPPHDSIYFGELAFEAPTEEPWHPPIDPLPEWGVHFLVYMTIIPHIDTDDIPKTTCPQQWPEEPNGNGNGNGDGNGGLILILLVIGMMAIGGVAAHER